MTFYILLQLFRSILFPVFFFFLFLYSYFSYILSIFIHSEPKAALTCLVIVLFLHFKMVTVKIWADVNMEYIKLVTSSRGSIRSLRSTNNGEDWSAQWCTLSGSRINTRAFFNRVEKTLSLPSAGVAGVRFIILLLFFWLYFTWSWYGPGKQAPSGGMCLKPKTSMTSFPTPSNINSPEKLLVPLTMQLAVFINTSSPSFLATLQIYHAHLFHKSVPYLLIDPQPISSLVLAFYFGGYLWNSSELFRH